MSNVNDVDRLPLHSQTPPLAIYQLRYIVYIYMMNHDRNLSYHEMVVYRLIKEFLDKFIEIIIKINRASLIDLTFPRIGRHNLARITIIDKSMYIIYEVKVFCEIFLIMIDCMIIYFLK